jgi:hypothetical protein
VFRGHARLAEALGDVPAVLDGARERDGADARGVLVPVLDDVADQRALVHGRGEFVPVVVVARDADARQVDRARCGEHARLDQKPGVDQLAHRGDHHERIKRLVQPAVVGAVRRRGEPEHDRAGALGEHALIRRGERAVRLVDDDHVEPAGVPVHERLHRADLHGGAGAHAALDLPGGGVAPLAVALNDADGLAG